MIAISALTAFMLLTRRWEAMSFHIFFVIGLIQFYFLSMAVLPWVGENIMFVTHRPTGTGLAMLAVGMPAFTIIYLISYAVAKDWTVFDPLVPKIQAAPSEAGLIVTIAVSMFLAILVFAVRMDNLGALFLSMVRPALAAFAAGLAVAYWIKRMYNPFAITLMISMIVLAVLISLVGTVDRRYPLSALMVVPWMLYWCWLRYAPIGRQATILAVMGFSALVFLLAYTNVRHTFTATDLTDRVAQIQNLAASGNDVFGQKNLYAIFLQDAPANTMYIMEAYGGTGGFPLKPLNGILCALTNPIPRALWEGKPDGIGADLGRQLQVPANLGAGIIGHGWIEGMWPGVIGYAIFWGVLNAVLDGLLRRRAWNPYYLAAVGTPLGHVLGLVRGETSLFSIMSVYSVVACLLVVYVTSTALKGVFLASEILRFGDDADNPYVPEDEREELLAQREAEAEGYDLGAADDPYADAAFNDARKAGA